MASSGLGDFPLSNDRVTREGLTEPIAFGDKSTASSDALGDFFFGATAAASDAAASIAGSGAAFGASAAIAATIVNAAGTGAVTGQAASIASSVYSASGSGTVAAVGEQAPREAVAFATGSGDVTATGASVASAVAFSAGAGTVEAVGASTASTVAFAAGLAALDAEGASDVADGFEDAAFSMGGTGTATGAAASIAASVVNAAGVSDLLAEGAFDGDAPEVEAPEAPGIDAGGGAMHPDLSPSKKKRKPRIIRLGESGDAPSAEAQAEADFRTLWEAVKIRDNPKRLDAVAKKRAAMLADLEKATLIRKAG